MLRNPPADPDSGGEACGPNRLRVLGKAMLLVVMAAAIVGCGADESDLSAPGEAPSASTTSVAGNEGCGGPGYPCSWVDVAESVHRSEAELADGIASILEGGGDLAQAYEWISEQADVVEAYLEETMVVFRVDGGMPHVTIAPIATDDTGPATSSARLIETSWMGPSTHRPVMDVVGVGTDRELPNNRKRALILQPYEWQGLTMTPFAGDASIATLRALPDYAHDPDDVVVHRDDRVTPFMFQDWDAYDVIFIETHGGEWGGGTWIATGVKVEKDPERSTWSHCADLMEPYRDLAGVKCGTLFDRDTQKTYVNLGTIPKFWESEYAARGGLDKAVIYMGGCLTLTRADVPSILAGESSAYFGWTGTVYFDKEGNVASALLYLLANDLLTTKAALDSLVQNDLSGGDGFSPSGNTQIAIYDNSADPGGLRIYDVPTFVEPNSPTQSTKIEDGARLEIIGTPGDGVEDKLDIAVDLRGIIHPEDANGDLGGLTSRGFHTVGYQQGEAARRYNLRFYVDDTEIGIDNLAEANHPTSGSVEIGKDRHLYTYTADLGFDLEQTGREVTLEVEVSLPEGGVSDYEVDVELIGGGCSYLSGTQVSGTLARSFGDAEQLQVFGEEGPCRWSAERSTLEISLGGRSSVDSLRQEVATGNPGAVDGFGDAAIYDVTSGNALNPSGIEIDGEINYNNFVNLFVVVDDSTAATIHVRGNIVIEEGPESGLLQLLQQLVERLRGN